MLSKEELLELLKENPAEAALPKDAITTKSVMEAIPCAKTTARQRVKRMLRDGKIVLGGHYIIRSSSGARKTPYFLPANPIKKPKHG